MREKFILAFLLIFIAGSDTFAFPAATDATVSLQADKFLQARPPGAPVLGFPAYAGIKNSIQAKGAVRVIVRLAAPASMPGGFPLEAGLNHSEAINQRSTIRQLQDSVLSRVSLNRSGTARRYDFIPFMAMDVDQTDLQALIASPEVDFIEEDIVVPPLLAQSVPLIGGVNGTFDGYTGSGQTVAILDTGVEKSHPFLTDKVVAEGCFSTTSASSTAYCSSGSTSPGSGLPCSDTTAGCYHGTHVAGVVAGNHGPTGAPSGVAKDADLIAIQVFSQFSGTGNCGSYPTCPQAFSSDMISALQHVYDLRNTYNIASVNMSLGGGQFTSNCDAYFPSFKAAVDNLRLAGIATVVASGNNGYTDSISFPACISSAISVGATDKSDVVASYSNSSSFLNLLAPGSSIYSSLLNASYGYLSGTSMATPHVAGAWAVVKSAMPTASVEEVLNALVNTGRPVTDTRNLITESRIQLGQAINYIEGNPINGACGSASGQTFNIAPSINLCSIGITSTVSGSGPWNWDCDGLLGGSTASCSANIATFSILHSVTNGTGGALTATASSVPYGGSVTFTINPDTGYTLAGVTDNGVEVSPVEGPPGTFIYSINNVTENHIVVATFTAAVATAVPALPSFGFSAALLIGSVLGYGRLSGMRKNYHNK